MLITPPNPATEKRSQVIRNNSDESGRNSASNLLRDVRRSDLLTDIDRCLSIRFHEEKPFILLIGENHANQNHPLAQLIIIKHLLSRFSPLEISVSYELRHDFPQRIKELIDEDLDDGSMMDLVAACLEEAGGFSPFAHAAMLRTVSKWGIFCQFTDVTFTNTPLGASVVSLQNGNCIPENISGERGIVLRNEFAYAQTAECITTRSPKIHIHIGGAIHIRGGNSYRFNVPYRGSLSDIYDKRGHDVMGVILSNHELNSDFCCPEDFSPLQNSFFCNSQSTVWIPGTNHIRGIDDDGEREREFIKVMMMYLFPDESQDTEPVYSFAREKLAENRHKIHDLFVRPLV